MIPSATRRRTSRLALAVLLAAGALAVPAAGRETPLEGITVSLAGPPSGSLVPYYGGSPLFRWHLTLPAGGRGTIWLEVSTRRDFRHEALQTFDCGYTAGACRSAYRWLDRQPYWYDLGDSCADLPPIGTCSGLSGVFYWRVRFEPEGTSRKASSPIGMIRRAGSTDHQPPVASALAGTAIYGSPARFFFYDWDGSGVVRAEFELYDGDRVVYGARNDWDRSNTRAERYEDVILPASVGAGSYRWCLTDYDYSGNHATSCAPYSITS